MRRIAAGTAFLALLLTGLLAGTLAGAGYVWRFGEPVRVTVRLRPITAPPHTVTSPPAQLRIPAIGVDTALQPLGLLPDGTLQPPSGWHVAGWYAGGPWPGDPGPAVIAGHVDSIAGPAVFFRLRQLRPGDRAVVDERNGHQLTFIVDTVASYPKAHFPTEAVYGPTALPVLRLVTCTGDFDWTAHSYLNNLVVSAHLAT